MSCCAHSLTFYIKDVDAIKSTEFVADGTHKSKITTIKKGKKKKKAERLALAFYILVSGITCKLITKIV